MKNNVKILAWALIAAITATSIWVSFADNKNEGKMRLFNNNFEKRVLTDEQKTQLEEIKTLLDKKENWGVLTTDEQAKIDTFEANKPRFKWNRWWMMGREVWMMEWMKWWFINNLTTEEKSALENMTNDEKKAFFEKKREEQKVLMESRENVIDKLLAGEILSAEEELIRVNIIKERAERKPMMGNFDDDGIN